MSLSTALYFPRSATVVIDTVRITCGYRDKVFRYLRVLIFRFLYPFYFFGLLQLLGAHWHPFTLTNLTLLHIFIFYANPMPCCGVLQLRLASHWRIRWDAGAKHGTLQAGSLSQPAMPGYR
jgi:hypothetical protein